MRFLITTLPGYGHICPLVPLARALQAAGHEVAFATSASAAGMLIPADLPVFSCGPAWSETDFSHDTAARAHSTIATPLHKYLPETVVPKMMSDIDLLIKRWWPDVVLSNEYERTGCVLAEKHAIPFVLVSAGPRISRSLRRQWHAPLYAVSRKIAGLSMDYELSYPLKWLHLYLAPPEYALEPSYQEAGNEFGIHVKPANPSISDIVQIDALKGRNRKCILCTFGTVFNKSPQLIKSVIAAFEDSIHQLIVTTSKVESSLITPKNVVLLDEYVPLEQIMPHTDLCITHGGTSTLLTLLQSGKPLFLLPQGADQNVNAMACTRLGLAECNFNSMPSAIGVEVGEVLIRPNTVRTTVDRLLEDNDLQRRAQALSEQFNKLPKLDCAVALLEQLARTQQPIVRSDC